MKDKFISALKSPAVWVALVVGLVVALAFRRFIPAKAQALADALPGSDAKAGKTA